MKRTDHTPTLHGQRWRDTHQATIDAILGPNVRSVRSMGSQFFNKDNWTARAFVAALCEWARLNKGHVPDRLDVEGWVFQANKIAVNDWQKGITIASTPDDLSRSLASALMGGGYHEAWHTEFSRRTHIRVDEVWPKVLQLWSLIPYAPDSGKPGWTGLTGSLLAWSNIIEDIRIERLGCAKYPGTRGDMEALQDLIIDMENEGRVASEHRGAKTNDDLSVVMGTFRDIGLGYQTATQRTALLEYQTRSPSGWKFVTEGPLKSMLDRSIALRAEDSLGSLWLAMETVAAIVGSAPDKKPKKEEKEKGTADLTPKDAKEIAQPEIPEEPEEGEVEPEPSKPMEMPPMTEEDKKRLSLILYKVGDRATMRSGPYAGRLVEVVRAGLPAEDGVQVLEFALVEDEV